ncbi:putative DNA helicase MCM8 [Diplonema papillatum]|nr:putative DNA helicase MCM8 [Diplonema papillatum]
MEFCWSQRSWDLWKRLSPEVYSEQVGGVVTALFAALRARSGELAGHVESHPLCDTVTIPMSLLADAVGEEFVWRSPDLFFVCLDFVLFQLVRSGGHQTAEPNRWGSHHDGDNFLFERPVRGLVDPATVDTTPMGSACDFPLNTLCCWEGIVSSKSAKCAGPATDACFRCSRCSMELWSVRYRDELAAPLCKCGGKSVLTHALHREREVVLIKDGNHIARVHFDGHLASRTMPLGSAVKVVGFLREADKSVHGPVLEVHNCSFLPLGHKPLPLKRATALHQLVEGNKSMMLNLVVNSVSMDIVGHEMEKFGLLLAVVGGCDKANGAVRYPGRVNVLVVGDKSVGKSMLLRSVARLAPRSSFLTNTEQHLFPQTGDKEGFATAGLLSESDQGVVCLDDVTAAPLQTQRKLAALMRAGESGCTAAVGPDEAAVSPTVLCTASPDRGLYDAGKTLAENFPKASDSLLGSFHLVLSMLNSRSEEAATSVSSFVMDNFGTYGKFGKTEADRKQKALSFTSHDPALPLLDRLRLDDKDRHGFEPMPPDLLRQLIILSKSVDPVVTQEHGIALERFCNRLRDREKGSALATLYPIDRCFFATVINLFQARARLELSREVQRQHVSDVVEFVLETREMFQQQYLRVDPSTSKNGPTAKQGRRFLSALQKYKEKEDKDLFSMADLKSVGVSVGIDPNEVRCLVERLNTEGCIIRASGKYRILS